MARSELVESIYALGEEIKYYEKKYGIASEDFYDKLDDGEYEQTNRRALHLDWPV